MNDLFRASCLLPACLLLASVTGVAHAQDEGADAPADEAAPDDQARSLYLRGDRLYAEGHYEESLAAFEEAHRLSGRPVLLFNIANVYERLGRLDEARAALLRYSPDAPEEQRSTVVTRIANLEERLRAEDEERRAAAAQANAPASTATSSSATAQRSSAPAATESSSSPLPAVGGVLLGVGGLAIVGGIVMGVLAGDRGAEAEALCVNGVCPEGAEGPVGDQASLALGADILWIGGAALAATGLTLLIIGLTSDDSESVALRAGPTLGGARLELAGAF
ncbi:MAG: tol-pal system YbgF family protein [Sandaracinaceae bacterium]